MKLRSKLAAGLAVLTLGAVPSVAGATGSEYKPEHPAHPSHPAHPEGSPKGHGYGYYCKGESRKHVEGSKRTPFAECVRAAARADHNEKLSPKQACKELSKKHVKGQKGTPFSQCVTGVAHMRREERRKEREERRKEREEKEAQS